MAIFSNRLLAGEALDIFGDGEQTRDYVYVGDVTRANLFASDVPLAGTTLDDFAFNVGTGVETSVNRLSEVLEKVSRLGTGRILKPARPGELQRSTLDVSKIADRGWSAEIGLEEGLERTFTWIADRTRTSRGVTQ